MSRRYRTRKPTKAQKIVSVILFCIIMAVIAAILIPEFMKL